MRRLLVIDLGMDDDTDGQDMVDTIVLHIEDGGWACVEDVIVLEGAMADVVAEAAFAPPPAPRQAATDDRQLSLLEVSS